MSYFIKHLLATIKGILRGKKFAFGIIGDDLASQNDLKVAEYDKNHAEATIASYIEQIERLEGEIKDLRISLLLKTNCIRNLRPNES